MSGILGPARSPGPTGARPDGTTQTPRADAQALAAAKQALAQAQGRVDADHRAHSPGCATVDQKGVDKAAAELAQAEAAENAATASTPAPATNRALSITA